MPSRITRRTFLLSTAAISVTALSAACGSTAPAAPTSAPASTNQGAGTTPTAASAAAPSGPYKGKFVVVAVYNDQQGEGKLEKKFMQDHPGVEITHVTFPSDKFVELYTASKNAGEQVDILGLNGQDLRRYATGGDLVDLSSVVQYKDRFKQVGIRTYSINGKLWALPWGGIGGFNIYYNKTVLDKHGMSYPKTYADLVQQGQKLKADNIYAYSHAGKVIYLWPVWFFTTYAQTSGNQSIEKTIKTLKGELKFTDPEVIQGLDAIFKFSNDDLFIPGVNSQDTPASTSNLITGKSVYALGLDVKSVRDANPPDVVLDAALLPLVVDKPGVKSQFPGGTGVALAIPAQIKSERRKLAEEYLDYMTKDENLAILRDENKIAITTNQNVEGSNDPLYKKVSTLVDDLVTYLDWLWPPQITRAFQEGIQAGVAKQKKAEQVASDIQAAFDKLVADGYKWQE